MDDNMSVTRDIVTVVHVTKGDNTAAVDDKDSRKGLQPSKKSEKDSYWLTYFMEVGYTRGG